VQVAPLAADRAPVSFLIDYDGTISLVDIGDTLIARHYGNPAEVAAKDVLYDNGQLGSRELMQWDMDVLPADADLLRREAAEMPQDQGFVAFVGLVEGHGAQVEVVSDGLGFYVQSNLAALGLPGLAVATNANRVKGGGAGMSFPFGHPACFVCGTCKRERVRLHQAAGRVVVFIGDGTSDRYAAAHADVVFAKDGLARICAAEGWPFLAWTDFADISAQVESGFSDGRLPRRPTDLPAWRSAHPVERPFICGPEAWGADRSRPPSAAAATRLSCRRDRRERTA
jgi:2-hydroxy-3-keto-5-methylthiopentenyl-1-phosphate phosphatase